MVHLEHRPRRRPTVCALAAGVAPTPSRRDTLPEGQVAPLATGRLPLPAAGRQDGLDRLTRPAHPPRLEAHEAPALVRLYARRVEARRQGQPARLGGWPLVLAAWQLQPGTRVGQPGRQIRTNAVRQTPWYPGRGPTPARPEAPHLGPSSGSVGRDRWPPARCSWERWPSTPRGATAPAACGRALGCARQL
jgi:hypothetical protein